MPESCTCGAQLPPDARFCHKCGKPQFDYPGIDDAPVPAPEQPAAPVGQLPVDISFHNRIAVRAGFIAALGAVILFMFPLPFPFLRLLFAFIAAGFIAVYLYSRSTGQSLSIRSGAKMGWITGIFSFTIITVLFTAAMVAISTQVGLAAYVQQHKDQLAASGAQSEAFTQALNDPAALAVLLLFSLLTLFAVLTILPTVGGALGAKVLAKE